MLGLLLPAARMAAPMLGAALSAGGGSNPPNKAPSPSLPGVSMFAPGPLAPLGQIFGGR